MAYKKYLANVHDVFITAIFTVLLTMFVLIDANHVKTGILYVNETLDEIVWKVKNA